MVLGTKERIVADRQFATERYILSTNPLLYLPLYRLDGSSFLSADGMGYLCSVTGALWTPQGRTFGGTGDKITLSVSIPSAGTLEGWFYWGILSTTKGVHQSLYSHLFQHSINNYIYTRQATRYWTTPLPVVGKFNHIVLTWTDSTNELTWNYYLDTVLGTPVGGGVGVLGLTRIGCFLNDTNFFQGKVGEVLMYNRALTPLEIGQLHQVTKWRYK